MINSVPPLSMQALEGDWYVYYTNFPMWLKGDKTLPKFTYRIIQKGKYECLDDTVTYLKNGTEKKITGTDFSADKTNTFFIWRGKGLLGLFVSKWKIIYWDANEGIAILHFSKTIATPEGYDIICRKEQLDEEVLTHMTNVFKQIRSDITLTCIRSSGG